MINRNSFFMTPSRVLIYANILSVNLHQPVSLSRFSPEIFFSSRSFLLFYLTSSPLMLLMKMFFISTSTPRKPRQKKSWNTRFEKNDDWKTSFMFVNSQKNIKSLYAKSRFHEESWRTWAKKFISKSAPDGTASRVLIKI